jgi:hypothetical protein
MRAIAARAELRATVVRASWRRLAEPFEVDPERSGYDLITLGPGATVLDYPAAVALDRASPLERGTTLGGAAIALLGAALLVAEEMRSLSLESAEYRGLRLTLLGLSAAGISIPAIIALVSLTLSRAASRAGLDAFAVSGLVAFAGALRQDGVGQLFAFLGALVLAVSAVQTIRLAAGQGEAIVRAAVGAGLGVVFGVVAFFILFAIAFSE